MALLDAGRSIRDRGARLAHVLPLVLLFASAVRDQTVNEYEVKAAYLYNFAKFVDWPADTFKSSKDAMQICVLGENPFGGMLQQTVQGKTARGRSFAVREIDDISKAPGCQILFISGSEHKHLKFILSTPLTGVLTVGETEGFCAEGGVVNFRPEDGRIVFEINVEAATRAKLRISANVLSLARIVKSREKQ